MKERDIDRELVKQAQAGDKQSFDRLVEKYQRKLGRLLSRYVRDHAEVEDVAQEAFIKAYRALPSFRGESAFYTWLYRIGINTAKNYLVAKSRRAPTSTDFDSDQAESFDDAGTNSGTSTRPSVCCRPNNSGRRSMPRWKPCLKNCVTPLCFVKLKD